MRLLDIFKAGTHTDANGHTVTISDADLQRTALAYDPTKHEAPIVVGHPQLNAPAYGWIQSLANVGPQLQATPTQVDPAFAELVKEGKFKKISASFYSPEASANPVPGTYYLRHVGFLGATPPAIKGLKAVEFGDSEEGVIEFSDWADSTFLSFFRGLRDFMIDQFGLDTADKVISPWMLEQLQTELVIDKVTPQVNQVMGFSEISGEGDRAPLNSENPANQPPKPMTTTETTTDFAEREATLGQRETQLRAREIAIQRHEFLNFAEDLVNQGKLLPAQKSAAVELLAALSLQEPQVVEFGEGETAFKGDLKTLFEGFLTAQPKVVEYGEFATTSKEAQPMTAEEIAAKATEYRDAQKAKGITVSFAEAVSEVTK